MEHIVTGCKDCPFCVEEDGEHFCYHPENLYKKLDTGSNGEFESLDVLEFVITPLYCPLNKESITIIKK